MIWRSDSTEHGLRSADGDASRQVDDRVVLLPLPADLLVRLRDVDDLLHAGEAVEPRGVDPTVVAHESHGGALRSGHRLGLIPHLPDDGDDTLNLLLGRPLTHHDQHDVAPLTE
jgi:hypothetical protein